MSDCCQSCWPFSDQRPIIIVIVGKGGKTFKNTTKISMGQVQVPYISCTFRARPVILLLYVRQQFWSKQKGLRIYRLFTFSMALETLQKGQQMGQCDVLVWSMEDQVSVKIVLLKRRRGCVYSTQYCKLFTKVNYENRRWGVVRVAKCVWRLSESQNDTYCQWE